jgi:2-dehydropantoate 2-reductase
LPAAHACGLAFQLTNILRDIPEDLARGRATEIDSLNGYVVARGDALGVPVPMNRALHALVRMLERERAARG